MIAPVIVMKFGGTSVGGPAPIRQVAEIVKSQLDRDPVVVVSAHAGITDALLAVAATAPNGDADVAAIVQRHRDILAGLELDTSLLDPLLGEFQDLVRGIGMVGEATAKAVDALLSYGERCSARVVAAALCAHGVAATAVDAFDAGLRTDSAFGRARPLADDGSIRRALADVAGVPVVTGFIGGDEHGNVTTLGRNGSDYSAALFGAALGVERIQIWKDVDGVHTADPRLVTEAQPIRRMSFADVADLAAFGSQVLHPAAMVPAMQRGIPMQIRNTGDPAAEGTTIEAGAIAGQANVHAIAHRRHMALLTVRSQRLVPQHTFLAGVFATLDALACDAATLTVAEAAVTVVVAADLADALAERLIGHGEVQGRGGFALVGVVADAGWLQGDGLAEVFAEAARVAAPLGSAALGASGSTVAIAVEDRFLADTVRSLHRCFFS